MTARIWVEAIAFTAEGEGRLIVRGQTAKALIELVNGGGHGTTALEAASWAHRHLGCWHGRRVLETPVRTLFVADPGQEADAA